VWGFLLSSVAVYNAVCFFMKKRLSVAELYVTVWFSLATQSIVDTFASFEYDAWGFFVKERVEFEALVVIFGLYVPAAVMIVNWYPFGAAPWRKLLYLLAWSSYSTAYEALAVRYGVIWHDRWSLLHSFLLYPFIYYLLILHLHVFRRFVRRRNRAVSPAG